MSIKTLIADDDKGVRLLLSRLINKKNGFKLIGEAEDGESVLSFIENSKPDLVFLDVEMPGLNGIECAKRIIDIDPMIHIIFATAHFEYMPEAFDVYAFDYIIKPFSIERVEKTLDRIKIIRSSFTSDNEIMKSITPEKLMIKNRDSISFVDTADIILIQREDRNTVIYTMDTSYTTSESLNELEQKLNKSIFLRSHKSYLINTSYVLKIYPYGRWTYIVKLKGISKDALLTHEKCAQLQEMFGVT